MLSWIREKFGRVIIGAIIAFIAFVFIFYGVFSPKSTRGLHEGAVAGTVNGDPISIAEFNRELNRRVEFFKNLAGGKLSDEQLKGFRIKEGVFQELANRKILVQEAQRQGLLASDEEVKEKITEIPAFQKDGKFDLATYKQVLEANNHTPASFERLIRDDISMQQWDGYFQDRVQVAEEEVKKEFLVSQDKRDLKYVLLTAEGAKKNVSISNEDIKKFLEDSAKLNLAKMKFDEGKNGLYKGQKFEDVKETIARSILATEKMDEIQKINEKLADQVLATMTAEKSSDAKVNALLKTYNSQVKTTGMISRQNPHAQGLGDAKELMADAFVAKSPIDPKPGGKAKKYLLPGRIIVAMVVDSKSPDLASLEKERDGLLRQITSRKMREMYQDWMKKVVAKAKIDTNPAVVGSTVD
jgi:parvulin-like peptidyl-prolyl isomerase